MQLRRFGVVMVMAASASLAAPHMVMAEKPDQNDSVDYAPRTKAVAGTLPLAAQYTLAVSAPTQLNEKGMEQLPSGITADLRVNVAFHPEGSSPAEALALVSVVPSSLTFYALGETHETMVSVTASANTTPGDYLYTIQAVGPTGLGWGISNHTLSITVSQPVLLDRTPPDVTITSPADGTAFTFCTGGTAIPVTISAVDPESAVTAVGGTVNGTPFAVNPFSPSHSVVAEGGFTAAAVGSYVLEAWATSVGGTGRSPQVSVSVSYAMSWLPPVSQGRTLRGAFPIKFAARDCQGNFVTDASVRVEVWEGNVLRKTAVLGDGSDAVRIETDQYVTNFNPPAGLHTYTVKVFFNNFLQASTSVATQ